MSKGDHTFPKSISPKGGVIVQLEFELAYTDVAVHYVSLYMICNSLKIVYIYIYIYIYIYGDRPKLWHEWEEIIKFILGQTAFEIGIGKKKKRFRLFVPSHLTATPTLLHIIVYNFFYQTTQTYVVHFRTCIRRNTQKECNVKF